MKLHLNSWHVAIIGWISIGLAPSQPLVLLVATWAIGYLCREQSQWGRHAKLLGYAALIGVAVMLLGFVTHSVTYHLVSLWWINAGVSGTAFCLYQLRKHGI